MSAIPTARTRRTFATLLVMLTRSTLREPIGLFFTLILAPLLVAVLGVLFGNDPSPQFGGRGFMDATLPACACLVMGMTGIIILPTNQLQLRESGALTRLRATPLSPRVFVAADLTVNFLISLVGIVLALLVGALGFGVRLQGSPLAVLAAAGGQRGDLLRAFLSVQLQAAFSDGQLHDNEKSVLFDYEIGRASCRERV